MTQAEAHTCPACHAAGMKPGWTYCPRCSQALVSRRISWGFIRSELTHALLRADKGLLYTLRRLLWRPGAFLRAYLDGLRARHAKPLTFLVVAAVAYAGVAAFLGATPIGDAVRVGMDNSLGEREVHPNDAAFLALFEASKGWLDRHYALFVTLLVPFEALAFRLAFRRFRSPNLPEWMVVSAYLTGVFLIFLSLRLSLQHWLPASATWALWAGLVYVVWAVAGLFRPYPWWKGLLRSACGLFHTLLLGGGMIVAAVLGLAFWASRH